MHRSIITRLRDKGYRITPARKTMTETVLKMKKPFSALEMHALLQKRGFTINTVTVYRELQFLEKEGIIQGTKFQDGTKRFCLASNGHHHHLICTNCNDVADVDMPCTNLHAMEKQLAKKSNFTIKSHSLEFYGLCARCS
jgi:Fur family ferric uptake transcriptional regulator